jgi:plasmid stability protein
MVEQDRQTEKDVPMPPEERLPIPDPTKLTTDAVNQAVKLAKEYTDLRIATILQRLTDMDRATAVLDETVHRTPTEIQREVSHLKELVFAEIEAARRGLTVAEQEREKAAQSLSAEREKAAQALAVSLSREITAGNVQLRDHVDQQVGQLRSLIESVRREAALIQTASEQAVAKAEELNRERWEGNQIWRDRAADRERDLQQEIAKLSAIFLHRDTAEAQFERLGEKSDAQYGELRRALNEVTAKVDRIA